MPEPDAGAAIAGAAADDAPATGLAEALAAVLPDALEPATALALAAGLVAGLILGALLGAGLAHAIGWRSRARLREGFAALSGEALDRNNERFLTLAGERLGALERASDAALARREAAVEALVRPLRESLARVDEKLQQVETEREGQYRSLSKHLELVATSHRELDRTTRGLAQALRTPNVRGRWGELQLRRVVELAGMLEHCDFNLQETLEGDSRQRPDLVIRLPGERRVVVDAKAPLQAYLAASEATDESERAARLTDHARHVRRHLDDLGGRAYWSGLEGTPEFVVLFLPGEPFFSAALAEDPELIERGVDRRVLLAGPTTLIALLRAIAYGWQQEAMARNAAEVASLGRELFDRLVTLNDRFETLGRRIDGAVEAYNAAIGSLESRVHVSARRMAELGVARDAKLAEPRTLDRRTRDLREPVTPDASGTAATGSDGGASDEPPAGRAGEGEEEGPKTDLDAPSAAAPPPPG